MTTPTPQVILGYGAQHVEGLHPPRVDRLGLHRDLSYVIAVPTRGMIPAFVVDSWMSLVHLPNTGHTQLMIRGAEVGDAYDAMANLILDHPVMSTWTYMVAIEEDNVAAPFALVELLTAADQGEWDALGGLYFTKGEEGVPQIWGDRRQPFNARPWSPWHDDTWPKTERIVPCWGTGMGFTAFRLDLFRRMRAAGVPLPWFKTPANPTEGVQTQDLFFYRRAHEAGIDVRAGIHLDIKVGHYDNSTGIVW